MQFKQFFHAATVITALSLFTASLQAADTYTVDPVHSSVAFKVRHFFNHVTGSFSKYDATLVFDADKPENNKATATIQISSISTRNADRDAHLQQNDFFDAAKFPTITYESTAWKKTGEKTYEVTGTLTFLGKTKPVTLQVELLGSGPGMGHTEGKTVIGLSGKGKINRDDWGLSAAAPVVGEEVEIELSIQASK